MSSDATADGTPIDVLLVDDNEQWARFLSQDLERKNERLHVSIATSANEALQRLRGPDDCDCLVTDYQMPEVNGIQLLERVRGEDREIPILLLTGEGAEDVAAEAISLGASDYLIKDPKADQTTLLERRISAAVEQHRLQQSIAESEERYRTVTEQSSDAIVIVQDGRAAFWNRRLAELVGYEGPGLDAFDPVEKLVHPEDRAAVRDAIDAWYDGSDDEGLQEARILTREGETRHWELAGRAITYAEAPAVLISARDVTRRKRRKRELEWERELNRNVQRALVESRTREDLEGTVCEQLHQYGYALAWIGRVADGELRPDSVCGDSSYVDSVTLSLDDEHDTEPSVWAARSREPAFVDDFEELFATGWRDAAREAGYRSGAALPIVHDGIFYGVLAVYDRRSPRFDETERSLLLSLAETTAFAIHSIETHRALASRHVVELGLRLHGDGYYLNEVAQRMSGGDTDSRVVVEGTVPYEEGRTIQYLTAEGIAEDAVRAAATEHPAVVDVDTVWTTDDSGRFTVVVDGPTPESRLADLGAVVRETVVRADGATLHVEIAATQDPSGVIERLESEYPTVSVESLVETDREVDSPAVKRLTGELTDKQAVALRAAFHQGYFESPRKSSATAVAASLGVSHSTFLQHLRAAQQKVFGEMYG
ncbi:bacterio-opsin activator domain-containing protein [Halobellus sp. GM3]|uniref:bacterio-opsin activator domain-containing protein n=1 Tax=Halobellus sp. GM3 TaxID=3458410 RepID=UPI00403DB7CA